ncbi:hypothetical protein GCM10010831_11560 [Psychroflexus salis]|uniref:Uncharacterized protein n=1 Tax=Psychroflexus salis TaxID=1526574 RepID=A0A917E7H2_9FLAO|nr:hypothetical protein GCM10010831_11560 [Psychroflexus salis]
MLSKNERTIPYLPFFVNETTEVQFIHNAPDPNLELVDIYVNGSLFLDDVNFRSASAFLSIPANEAVDIGVALGNSSTATEAFFTTTLNLVDTDKYLIVANGVQNTGQFDASENSNIEFSLDVFQGARENAIAIAGNTDILIHHGATDLPNIDLDEITVPVPNFITNLAYTNFEDYTQIATNNYSIQPVLSSSQTELEIYDLPLSELVLQNKAVTLLTSGFLNPELNQNGPEFGLWLAQPEGGDLIELPFQGECITSLAPFSENFSGQDWAPGAAFENTGDSIDECWTRIPDNLINIYAWGTGNSSSQIFNSGPGSAFQGNNFLYTKPFGQLGDQAEFISPVINTNNLDTPALSFYYFMFGNDVGSLEVEVKEFGSENWINIFNVSGEQQTSPDEEWLDQEIELTNYTNTKIQIKFTAIRGLQFANAIALDLIEVREATTCIKPSNASITQISDTSAQINWNTQSNPVNWFVFLEGVNPQTATPIAEGTTASNNTTVSGLNENTNYQVYLRSDCDVDGFSVLDGPINFSTAACPIEEQCEFTFNLLDDFGDGWNGNIVELRQDGQLVANLGADFESGDNFTETHLLCTGSTIELIWLNEGSFANEVGLNLVDPFNEVLYELNFDSGNQRGSTIFNFTSACTPPTCPKVTNVQAFNIVNDGVDLSWNAEPEASLGYTWLIFNQGANPATASPVFSESVDQSTNNVSISGLSPAQSYDAYVIANCAADDDSDFSDVVSFNTSCSTLMAPVFENFSSSQWVSGTGFNNANSEISECWERETTGYFWGTKSGASSINSTGPSGAFQGSNYIYAVGTLGNNGQTTTITSPQINLQNLTNPGISFYYFMRGNNIGELSLEVKSVNTSNWVELENIVGAQQTNIDDNWEEVIISLNAFEGETIEFRFVATRGNGFSSDIAIDAIEVNEVNPCLRPKNLEINNIDIDGAELTWTPADASATGFTWEIYPEGANPENATPVAEGTTPSNTTTAIITGLDADTTYDAYVFAECDEGEFSNLSLPISFSTLICNANETCVYTFELLDGFGDGWNGNTMSVLQNGIEIAVLGENFSSGNNFTETVSLCSNVNVELFWNIGGSFANEVGVTVLNPFDEEVYEKSPGEGSQGSTLTTFTSDCDAPDGCFPPLNFEVVQVTTDTVELSWDNIGSAISGYNWFIFNEDDNPQNTPPVANGSTNFEVNSVVISGLSENTNYKAFIRSDCGFTGVSSASDPLFFNTPCSPLATPYVVDFESDDWSPQNSGNESIGDCWNRSPEFEIGTYSWLSFSDNFINNPVGDNVIIITNQFGNSGDQAIIELPALDLSNLDEPSFNYFYSLTGSDVGTYAVEIKEISTSTWTNLKTYNTAEQSNLSDEFVREIFDLANFANQTVNIRFVATRSAANSVFFAIDDLRVDELPVCNPPLSLSIDNITTESAELTFNEDESAFEGYTWFAFESGADPETETPIATGTTNSPNAILIDGLSPASTYDVYVQSNCFNNEESELSESVTFSTEVCEEEEKCTYTFLLEDSAGNGWNGASMQVFQNGILVETIGENFSTGSESSVTVSLCADVTTELIWNNAGIAASELGISIIDPFNEEIYNSSTQSISPGQTIFSFTSNCTPPICPEPINVEVTNILQTEATLSWDEVDVTQQSFNWSVYLEGESPDFATPIASGTITSEDTTVVVNNLEINTTYQVYIQAICEFSESELTTAVEFTTFGECNAPENIVVDEVLINEVTFSWDDFTNALNGYIWEVYLSSEDQETATPSFSGTLAAGETSVTVTGLTELTDYNFYIQSDCNVVESDFSLAIPFSTIGDCVEPNGVDFQIDEVTQTSVLFSWSASLEDPGTYSYVVHTQGEGPDVSTAITSWITTTPNGFSDDLEPGTTYDVYIRNNCSFGFSDFVGPFTFTTLDPECEVPSNILITNISQDEITLSWSGVDLATNGYVWYIFDDEANLETDSPLDTGIVDSEETSVVIDGLSEDTAYQVVLQSDCDLNLSELSTPIQFVTENLVCETPDNLGVTLITDSTATLSWNETADSPIMEFNGYTWFIYNDGDIPGTDVPVFTGSTNDTFVDVSNLIPETTYQAYVQANCELDDSNLSAPVTFTTTDALGACQPAENITVSNISQTSIFLTWNPPADSPVVEYEWVIRETVTGFPIYSSGFVDPSVTEVSIDNLEPNTEYLANVVTDCGTQFRIPGESFAFTTLDVNDLPPNDDICNAIMIPEFSTVIGDNTNATVQTNEPTASCFSSNIESTVWFTYVAPSSSESDIIISALANTGIANVAVYEAVEDCTDLTSLVEVACAVGMGTGEQTMVSPSGLTQGETYYIQVNFDAANEGTFEISLETNFSNQDFNKLQISLYPNPANNILNVEAPENIEDIIIYNMLGQQVYKQKYNQNLVAVPVSNLQSGQYFAKVIINGKTFVEAFIKD